MIERFRRSARVRFLILALVALAPVAGCGGGGGPLPATGSMDADKFLFERGMGYLKEKKWFTAREYFRRLIDTYPTSAFKYDAKLAIGELLHQHRFDQSLVRRADRDRRQCENPGAQIRQHDAELDRRRFEGQQQAGATLDAPIVQMKQRPLAAHIPGGAVDILHQHSAPDRDFAHRHPG